MQVCLHPAARSAPRAQHDRSPGASARVTSDRLSPHHRLLQPLTNTGILSWSSSYRRRRQSCSSAASQRASASSRAERSRRGCGLPDWRVSSARFVSVFRARCRRLVIDSCCAQSERARRHAPRLGDTRLTRSSRSEAQLWLQRETEGDAGKALTRIETGASPTLSESLFLHLRRSPAAQVHANLFFCISDACESLL